MTGLRRRGKYLLVDLGPREEQAGRAVGGRAARPGLRRPVRGRHPPAHDRPAGLPSRARRAAGALRLGARAGHRAALPGRAPVRPPLGASTRRPRTSSSALAGWARSRSDRSSPSRTCAARCAGRRAPLKAFLLDQRRIAGVGNIYADEALFRARLHPLRAAGSVGPREAQRLHAALLETLQAGIDHEGSSIESFIDPAGQRGSFQEILNVYQRTGEPCRVCGTHRRARRGRRPRHALLPALPAAPRRHGAGVAAASRRDRAAALGQARRLGGAGPVNDRAPSEPPATGSGSAPLADARPPARPRLYIVLTRVPRRTVRRRLARHGDVRARLVRLRRQRGAGARTPASRGTSPREKPLRWHADYLFTAFPAERAWLVDGADGECELAGALAALPGAERRPRRFGAGDCRCAGHLVRFTRRPLRRDLAAAAHAAGAPPQRGGTALRPPPRLLLTSSSCKLAEVSRRHRPLVRVAQHSGSTKCAQALGIPADTGSRRRMLPSKATPGCGTRTSVRDRPPHLLREADRSGTRTARVRHIRRK